LAKGYVIDGVIDGYFAANDTGLSLLALKLGVVFWSRNDFTGTKPIIV